MASRKKKNPGAGLSQIDKNEDKLRSLMTGDNEAPKEDNIESLIAKVHKKFEKARQGKNINKPMETSRGLWNIDDSLLDVEGKTQGPGGNTTKAIRDILGNVSTSVVQSIFQQEQDRLSDYSTYRHIYEINHPGW